MPNALAHEKSPYLLQHAANPVAWLPWGEVAFARARAEQKPVFLSIGYSTCHWCHVMAHESFENAEVAELLNANFVPIKVDREERPDVDRVYMTYIQALTGHGGWPLNVWLTPELKPFHGGTYFPPEDRPGRPGLPSVLRTIASSWSKDRGKLVTEANRVITTLQEHARREGAVADDGAGPAPIAELHETASAAFEHCFQQLYESFDPSRGDFAGAPKFPRPANLNFLFRIAALQGADAGLGREAVKMAAATLTAMARGGVHDQVGGGFHRYAVDEEWFVPHFEKMLYDQAQIAVNCLDAHLATGDERFAWLARGIFDYTLRDLAHPAGGFYSAEDADSEVAAVTPEAGGQGPGDRNAPHAEGAFYVWTQAELEAALGAVVAVVADPGARPTAARDKNIAFFCDHFGVLPGGNVPPEQDPQGEFTGRNILHQRQSLQVSARAHALTPQAASELLISQLDRLRTVRESRPRPHRDDKIITAWNGLMINALARGATSPAACLADQSDRYRQAAGKAADFVERELYDANRGVLFRCWCEGRAASEGFAEDYAFLIAGLLNLYELTFDASRLKWAVRLQQTMDEKFWDGAAGGYFNSAAAAADIVLRLKEDHDGAEPSPNSIATANLLRLAAIFHQDAYRERAIRTIGSLRPRWSQSPHALPEMLCAIERALEPPRQIVLAGLPESPEFQALAAVARERPGPRRAIVRTDPALPWTMAMTSRESKATAYVCEDFACQPPVTTPADLRRLLA